MRLNHGSAPLRFVGGALGGWAVLRVALAAPWPMPSPVHRAMDEMVAWPRHAPPPPADPAPLPPSPPPAATTPAVSPLARDPGPRPPPIASGDDWRDHDTQFILLASLSGGMAAARPAVYVTQAAEDRLAVAPAPPLAPAPPPDRPHRASVGRLTGSAWAFVRQGSGARALASGGQLGGSQAGARIAIRIGRRVAAAGRVSAAIGVPGAEAAAGVDWLPAGDALRLSLERRVALDAGGRDAWSAYVAGGFYGAKAGLVLDGYGQAGVVGARSRDLFADGALRVARPVSPAASIGAGAWGAAQPGVARLDVGPRAALRLPGGAGVLAVDGRLRIAGSAQPGSGVAVTLARDF